MLKFYGVSFKIFFLCTIMQGIVLQANAVVLSENEDDQSGEHYVVVQQIVISNNKITKPRVILNELIFKQGDKILVDKLGQVVKRSRHNLLNTSLFNFVSIRYTLQADETVIFHVNVDERWYWWVFPIFEVADRNLSAFFDSQDWSRVNYGVYLKRDNFRGRNEKIIARVRLGFTTQILFGYSSPEYNKKGGWGTYFNFSMQEQLPYMTMNNQQVFKSLDSEMAQVSYMASIYYSLRFGLYQRHRLELMYNQYSVSDSIIDLNPNYLTANDSKLKFLELKYEYEFDKRDSKVYPLKGNRIKAEVSNVGFGVWQEDLHNLKFSVQYDKHLRLAERWNWASLLYGEYNTSDHLPYVLNTGSGYKRFLNGYELYVMDGTRQISAKNQMLFTLLKPRVKNIGFMPLTQFAKVNYALYLKSYYDFGYVWNENPSNTNTFVNDWQYGYGVGVDFVTFYDMVWSFNYSANKQKQHGFFVHFNLAF